jgi:hypothetical protein
MSWKYHIEHISSKLSAACFIIRSLKPYTSINTLKIVYYSYFNSIVNYGLPFLGNSPQSMRIFRIQKKVVRIMLGYRRRDSCRNLFNDILFKKYRLIDPNANKEAVV